MLKNKNILLGITGGIACYKVLDLCSRLKKQDVNLKIIMTKSASEFINPISFETMGRCRVYTDLFEGHHEEVHHIELAKWADLMLVAPASANTIAKFANGIADNFLTSTYLAFDKDVIIAPAMNTNMLSAKATQRNIDVLKSDGVQIIKPEPGLLACNTIGDGRLEEPSEIVDYLDSYFTEKDLIGKKIIISAGPTIEPIDFVRYVSNNSSGKMGYNIANEARKRGAEVVLVSGPVNPFKVNGIKRVQIKTNAEMKEAIEREFKTADALIMAAAPVDYRSKIVSDKKIKKDGNSLNLELIENIDIIKYFGNIKKNQIIIGFAAETDDLISNAKKKLESKNLDYIIANDLTKWGAGFDVDTNVASIISKDKIESLDIMPKSDLANKILDLLR
uniref:bifunctional phosphopantothenoylcysteine decarboxylase/phosphopantothenate--cysteine ligase CoaBC n=1 Tax=Anaerococcus mediterraneensis TaxID=1870984 RepID=UPI000931DC66|nr:bifunctional phosphopantothenoylcysteine decarboxylase/phosphopantothenate--cysteine ligase CoaBC [Anaerococcus mediterraneensis]